MHDIDYVSENPTLDYILGRTITPIHQITINLRNPEGFVAKWGKKVKAAGGKYQDCRGHQHLRYVYLPWTKQGREVCDAICSAHPSPNTTIVVAPLFNTFRDSHIQAGVEVRHVNTASCKSASAEVWRQYCKAFAAAFPVVNVNEPLTELEGTTAYHVPSRNLVGWIPVDIAPQKVLVGRKKISGYVCQTSDSIWGSTHINANRLFTTESDAWMEIHRQLSESAEQYRNAADLANASSAAARGAA